MTLTQAFCKSVGCITLYDNMTFLRAEHEYHSPQRKIKEKECETKIGIQTPIHLCGWPAVTGAIRCVPRTTTCFSSIGMTFLEAKGPVVPNSHSVILTYMSWAHLSILFRMPHTNLRVYYLWVTLSLTSRAASRSGCSRL